MGNDVRTLTLSAAEKKKCWSEVCREQTAEAEVGC